LHAARPLLAAALLTLAIAALAQASAATPASYVWPQQSYLTVSPVEPSQISVMLTTSPTCTITLTLPITWRWHEATLPPLNLTLTTRSRPAGVTPTKVQVIPFTQSSGSPLRWARPTLTLRVHPDGSVEPVYRLEAELDDPASGDICNATARLEYQASFTGDGVASNLSGGVEVKLCEPDPGLGTLRGYGALQAEARASGGILALGASGRLTLYKDSPTPVGVRGFTVNLTVDADREVARASFAVDADRATLEALGVGGALSPGEVNDLLAGEGLGFVRFTRLSITYTGGAARLEGSATIYLDKLRSTLARLHIDTSQLDSLLSDLRGGASFAWRVSLTGSVEATPAAFSARASLYLSYAGDPARAERYASQALQGLLGLLLDGLPGGGSVASLASGLSIASPSTATLTLDAREAHGGPLRVALELRGPRLVASSSEGAPPGERAEATLARIGDALTGYGLALASAANVPASSIVPDTVRLEPASWRVHLSASTAHPEDLGNVRVDVSRLPVEPGLLAGLGGVAALLGAGVALLRRLLRPP